MHGHSRPAGVGRSARSLSRHPLFKGRRLESGSSRNSQPTDDLTGECACGATLGMHPIEDCCSGARTEGFWHAWFARCSASTDHEGSARPSLPWCFSSATRRSQLFAGIRKGVLDRQNVTGASNAAHAYRMAEESSMKVCPRILRAPRWFNRSHTDK